MEVLVDTQILVNAVIENSEFHKEAKEILENNIIFVPSIVLEEFCFVLKKLGLENKFIIERCLDVMENSILVPVEKEDFEFAFDIMKKLNMTVFFLNDLLVLSSARRRNLELITFDKKLRNLYEKLRYF